MRNRVLVPAWIRAGRNAARRQFDSRSGLPLGTVKTSWSACLPTMTADGKPAIISDDYFDERIVEGSELAEPEDTTRENILAEAGYEQVCDIDEIITRMPTPNEVSRLRISPGTPVAEHIRTGYTEQNRPVRVMISIIPGDVLILEYKIPT
jgi:DNA-binding GntR family transcriptional regulator